MNTWPRRYEVDWPRLAKDPEAKPTSDETYDYNCISWVVGEYHRWWEPDPDNYWPIDYPDEYADPEVDLPVSAVQDALESVGFMPCELVDDEDGFELIAIYSENGVFKHVARKEYPKGWSSKLGPWADIRHGECETLEGRTYGEVTHYMKRELRAQKSGADLQRRKVEDDPEAVLDRLLDVEPAIDRHSNSDSMRREHSQD